ncbi:MAG: universal stress protein [Verrucomicrobia bacterium]|nr:universal stress protein [Verrucomicrobiota bacterium]
MKTKNKKTSVSVVVTDRAGHRRATAPIIELAPLKVHIRKIMVPLDFSEPSHQALRYARVFAEQFGASITLIHVVEPMLYPAELGYVPLATEDLDEKRMEEIRGRLDALAKDLGKTVKADTVLRLGRSWREICDAAKAADTDLLIIATHGYTGIKHALLGSTAERVVRHAPCPVLIVRSDEHDFA